MKHHLMLLTLLHFDFDSKMQNTLNPVAEILGLSVFEYTTIRLCLKTSYLSSK